jgi:hypothetical protein
LGTCSWLCPMISHDFRTIFLRFPTILAAAPGHLGKAGDRSLAPRSGVTPWNNPKASESPGSWAGVHDLLCVLYMRIYILYYITLYIIMYIYIMVMNHPVYSSNKALMYIWLLSH